MAQVVPAEAIRSSSGWALLFHQQALIFFEHSLIFWQQKMFLAGLVLSLLQPCGHWVTGSEYGVIILALNSYPIYLEIMKD